MDEFKKKIKKRMVLTSIGICAGLILFIAAQAAVGISFELSRIALNISFIFVILYLAFYITYMKAVIKDEEKLRRLYEQTKETDSCRIIIKAVYMAFSATAAAAAVAAPLFATFIDALAGAVLMFVLLIMLGTFAAAYICMTKDLKPKKKIDDDDKD